MNAIGFGFVLEESHYHFMVIIPKSKKEVAY
jgi:hypothetical protein